MSITKTEIRPGAYYDSIVLMQLQRSLADLPGVIDAGVVMATPANCELLAENDLLPKQAEEAGSNDLLIVVKGENEELAKSAIMQVDELLARRRTIPESEFRPKSLESASEQLPEAQWVLISVPGRYAAGVAHKALDLGKHVFLYSDNVSIQEEIKLKKRALKEGLLVMGPDCGTAIINGVGLGFANIVRRGKIGIIGASGTGLQAITVGVHELGAGISHAIGTGGRDLKSAIGGITAIQALDLLNRDPETSVIVIVSKPPEPEIVTRLISNAQLVNKPVVADFIGYPNPGAKLGNIYFSSTLQETAEVAVNLQNHVFDQIPSERWKNAQIDGKAPKKPQYLRGLFSGGTLAYEMMLGLQAFLFPLHSNVPITATQKLEDPTQSKEHTILDLGEDAFTVGRLHPMIDNDLRIRKMRREANDPEVKLLLLDLVLGEGSHTNPAVELAPVIQDFVQKNGKEVAVIVIGTDEDPQNMAEQISIIKEAGARVFSTTSEAIETIQNMFPAKDTFPKKSISLQDLNSPFAAINVGLESFYDSLRSQGAQAVHVDWKPPAGGNKKLMSILSKMDSRK